MKRSLLDMVVIITGASSGIGKALALELSARGAKLVLAARRLEKLQELDASLGGKHLVIPCDVAEPARCEGLVQRTVETFGRLDTLICNAGYGIVRRVANSSATEAQQMFQTNFFGTLDCIRTAVPILRAQEPRDGFRGQIMIVSSAAARRGLPYFGIYSATKAAQLSIAEALRVELQSDRIAVTSVHPIGTATEFFGVAEKGGKLPPDSGRHISQTAEQVARKMVRGIQRPRPEVWPLGLSRLGLSLGTFFPSLVDRAMRGAHRKIEKFNAGSHLK